jgi:hypothetical protein
MELKREQYAAEISRAKTDDDFVASLVEAVHPKKQVREIREMASQVLQVLAEDDPTRIAPYMELFYTYLKDKNAFSKMVCLYCIAGLVQKGLEPQFTTRLPQYMAMLDDESVMIASHCALNAGKIAASYPQYEPQITESFLAIGESKHNQSRKDLVTAYILEAFIGFAEKTARFTDITAFAWKHMENQSPKAREMAKAYLANYGLL